jgi:hypothetical protein
MLCPEQWDLWNREAEKAGRRTMLFRATRMRIVNKM